MGLFKKQKPSADMTQRRRPAVQDRTAQRTQAFSYYAQRKVPDANTGRGQAVETVSRQGPRAWYQNRLLTGFAGLVVIAAVCYSLNLSTSPTIVPMTAGSTFFLHDTNDYQQTAAETLGKSLFNHNKLTVDTAAATRALIAKYPEIRSAAVTVPLFGSRPVVYLQPYRPAFVLSTVSDQAFLIDETGRALAPTSQIPNMSQISVPTLEDQSGLSVQRGTQALPAGTVQFSRQVTQILDAAKVRYDSLVLPAGTSELDVRVAGAPYFVKFNLQGDARLETGTFLAARERLGQDKVTPAQYVDVRVPERAYYK